MKLEEEKEKLYTLFKINENMFSQRSLLHLLDKAIMEGAKLLCADRVTLKVVDRNNKFLYFATTNGTSIYHNTLPLTKESLPQLQHSLDRSCLICSRIFEKSPGYFFTVAIKSKDGLPSGILSFGRRNKKGFSIREIKIARIFASQLALAIKNILHIEKIRKLALIDELTGLYNQSYFYKRLREELGKACRSKQPLSILFMDVDNLKFINDTYGHLTGDRVLRLIAKQIKDNIRTMDIAFRYGGDEFVIILPEIDSDKSLIVAERINQKIKKITFPSPLSASIGIASFPEDAEKPRDLLAKADRAMYQAKQKDAGKIKKSCKK